MRIVDLKVGTKSYRVSKETEAEESMASHSCDVFVSYNHKDAEFVKFLVGSLERIGLSCFQDVARLKIFDKLDASLKDAIAGSRWLIAVISPNYLRSYWCLFEAIEAIQGQDLEVRFLPILVRASPADQSLDEDFVLGALDDLDKRMNTLERRIICSRAYELSAKLDKLSFVRRNLPSVFLQMQERIFPEFRLWDNQSVLQTMQQILDWLVPDANARITEFSKNPHQNPYVEAGFAPARERINSSPTSEEVGFGRVPEVQILLANGRFSYLTLPADVTPMDVDAIGEGIRGIRQILQRTHLGDQGGHDNPLGKKRRKASPAKASPNSRTGSRRN